ncbi:hypothetical protein DMUE_6295, partial [Dictyocoela muelleri]
MNKIVLINYLSANNYLKREFFCLLCKGSCNLRKYSRNIDGYAWRCMTTSCLNYKKYFSVRSDSFFYGINVPLKDVFHIILLYISRMSRISIINYLDMNRCTILKIIGKIIDNIPNPDFSSNKLGGENMIIQADETMLNYKIKNHRGRAPTNRTDALCIIEFDQKIKRVFACVIPNKEEITLVPIICSQVASNSTIWTDENRAYRNLRELNYTHNTVCHKYEFINRDTGVNTQAVECFN